MLSVRYATIRAVVTGCCALLFACRAEGPATASGAVLQFYTVRDALGGSGAPTADELAALRPFLSDALARGLFIADSLRRADSTRSPNEKPRFAEGDLFSSLFEGITQYRVMPTEENADSTLVRVEFTNNRARPVVRWTDTVVVVQNEGRWLVHDVRYGGTWGFGNKGTLLRQLTPLP